MTSRPITIGGFGLIFAAVALTQFLAGRPGSRIPTFGRAVEGFKQLPGGRVAIFTAWIWLGWHFLAR